MVTHACSEAAAAERQLDAPLSSTHLQVDDLAGKLLQLRAELFSCCIGHNVVTCPRVYECSEQSGSQV